MDMDVRPGNQINPAKPEPEYAKINVPIVHEEIRTDTYSGDSSFVRLLVCMRCGSYVWDLQAHENWHSR